MSRRAGSTTDQKMIITLMGTSLTEPLHIAVASLVVHVPDPFLGVGLTYKLEAVLPHHVLPGTAVMLSVPTVAPVRITCFTSPDLVDVKLACDVASEQRFTGNITPDAASALVVRLEVIMVQVLSFERQLIHWVRLGSPVQPCLLTLRVEADEGLRADLRKRLQVTLESGGASVARKCHGESGNGDDAREVLATMAVSGGTASKSLLHMSANARLTVQPQRQSVFLLDDMLPVGKASLMTRDGAGRCIEAVRAGEGRTRFAPATPSDGRTWCLEDRKRFHYAVLRIRRLDAAPALLPPSPTLAGRLLSVMLYVTDMREPRDPIVVKGAAPPFADAEVVEAQVRAAVAQEIEANEGGAQAAEATVQANKWSVAGDAEAKEVEKTVENAVVETAGHCWCMDPFMLDGLNAEHPGVLMAIRLCTQ